MSMRLHNVTFYPYYRTGRRKGTRRRRQSAKSVERLATTTTTTRTRTTEKMIYDEEADSEQREQQQNSENVAAITQSSEMLSYVKRVKKKLAGRPEAYRKFVAVVGQVGREDSNKIKIISLIIDLLDGYPDLIIEFAKFLPPGLEIIKQDDAFVLRVYESAAGLCAFNSEETSTSDDNSYLTTLRRQTLTDTCLPTTHYSTTENFARTVQRTSVSFSTSVPDAVDNGGKDLQLTKQFAHDDDALAYIRRVKQTFEQSPQSYKKFAEILSAYHSNAMNCRAAIESIVKLLQAHPDLVLGFNRFLPEGHRIHMYDNLSYSITLPPSTPHKSQERIVLKIDQKHLK